MKESNESDVMENFEAPSVVGVELYRHLAQGAPIDALLTDEDRQVFEGEYRHLTDYFLHIWTCLNARGFSLQQLSLLFDQFSVHFDAAVNENNDAAKLNLGKSWSIVAASKVLTENVLNGELFSADVLAVGVLNWFARFREVRLASPRNRRKATDIAFQLSSAYCMMRAQYQEIATAKSAMLHFLNGAPLAERERLIGQWHQRHESEYVKLATTEAARAKARAKASADRANIKEGSAEERALLAEFQLRRDSGMDIKNIPAAVCRKLKSKGTIDDEVSIMSIRRTLRRLNMIPEQKKRGTKQQK
jgi:hypothetical protein